MIKEKLCEDLFDKLPDKARVVIFGACPTGEAILNDMKIYRPQVEVIGFIDNVVKDEFCSLPIWTLKRFLELPKTMYDYVVVSTRKDYNPLNSIFDLYDIQIIAQTPFVNDYYRGKNADLTDENYDKVIKLFSNKEDRDLYEMLFKFRLGITHPQDLRDFYNDTHKVQGGGSSYTIKNQYLEKINKDKVKTIIDAGFNSGLNAIAYDKLLPNLETVYGFEVIYDNAKQDYIEDLLPMDKIRIVPYCLGLEEQEGDFYLNKYITGCSFCDFSGKKAYDMTKWEKLRIKSTTIDKFCEDNNVVPDLIKMDIEGAEPDALKGGIHTIKKYRTQLAISIYHLKEKNTHTDFVNIPIYLSENLENYTFKLGHYSPYRWETVLYAIPNELVEN